MAPTSSVGYSSVTKGETLQSMQGRNPEREEQIYESIDIENVDDYIEMDTVGDYMDMSLNGELTAFSIDGMWYIINIQ